jgi:hypothetical protein
MASTTGETTKDVLGAPTPRTSSNEDHLSSLAPETLLKILSLASISSFFALTQTSKGFRKFMKSNAALICNDATATRLPLLSACFESKIINKWLVPTHPVFLRCQELCNVPKEEFFRYYLYRYPDSDISELHEKYKYEIDIDSKRMGSDLLRNRGIFVVDMHVKLLIDVTKPGPQFLFFLEEMGEKVMDGWRTPNSKRKSKSYFLSYVPSSSQYSTFQSFGVWNMRQLYSLHLTHGILPDSTLNRHVHEKQPAHQAGHSPEYTNKHQNYVLHAGFCFPGRHGLRSGIEER